MFNAYYFIKVLTLCQFVGAIVLSIDKDIGTVYCSDKRVRKAIRTRSNHLTRKTSKMFDLTVRNIGTDRNVSLVVDSRLIAEVLGVNHGDWVRNIIKKYQAEIEEDFGQLRFENGYVNIPNGGKKETVYALLTEDQATA